MVCITGQHFLIKSTFLSSVSDQLFVKEPAKQLNPDTQEECNSSTDISFRHLSQTEVCTGKWHFKSDESHKLKLVLL